MPSSLWELLRTVRSRSDESVDCHQICVIDNGIGIDPKYDGKTFEMFHRLKEIEGQEGTGLELAIIERIVAIHSGRSWVESENGKFNVPFYFA